MAEKLQLGAKLDRSLVYGYLAEPVICKLTELQVLESTSSTNDQVMKSVQQGKDGFFACIANQQTAGRGRNGKTWQSPSNANIYMSIGWCFDSSRANETGGLALACGVTVARLLNSMHLKVGLKWPNDILLNDKKLAGLLLETRIQARKMFVVVGLGLNVDMPAVEAKKIDQPWIDLSSALAEKSFMLNQSSSGQSLIDRNFLVAQLLSGLIDCLIQYKASGFESFAEDWDKLDVLAGRNVIIKTDEEEVEAKVLGYGKDHGIRVKVNNEEKIYYAADIKLKLKTYVNN